MPKEKIVERNGLFQLPKSAPFGIVNNMGQTEPNFPQQPVLDFYPQPVRNVPQDPITQHTDQRTKPKVYESLIKPTPVEVHLQGTLPPYDANKIWEEYDGLLLKIKTKRRSLYLSIYLIIRYLELIFQKQLSSKKL